MTRDTEAAPRPPGARGDGARAGESRGIGRYRLVREQGTGLFGTVWLAEDTANGQRVALRLFPRELTDLGNVAETVRRRARAVVEASRAHPGLAQVFEYSATDDGRLFAVMERVEGARLSEWLANRQRLSEWLANRQRSDVPATLRLAIELGGPLEMLHNMGLVYGALRPRNIAIVDGRAVLMDVETIALRDAPALQALVATRSPAAYLAPEQIEGRTITDKTDVYTFALVLHEMLSGRPPFTGATQEALLDKQLKEPPPALRRTRRTVPAPVETALLEALDKRPERRPSMPRLLNRLASEAGSRRALGGHGALVAGAIVVVAAGAVGAPLAWNVLASRWSATPPVASPTTDGETEVAAPPASGSDPQSADATPATESVSKAAEPQSSAGVSPPPDVAPAPDPPPAPPPADPLPPAVASSPPTDSAPPRIPAPNPPGPVFRPPVMTAPPLAAPRAFVAPPAVAPPPPAPPAPAPPRVTERQGPPAAERAAPPSAERPAPPVVARPAPPAALPPAPPAVARPAPPRTAAPAEATASPATERPRAVASPASPPARRAGPAEEPDASAVIDWLLKDRAGN